MNKSDPAQEQEDTEVTSESRFVKLVKNQSLPILISIFAVFISCISAFFSYQANQLAIAQYKQERLLILKGVFSGEDKFSMSVVPISDSAHFMKGQVVFPSKIYGEPAPIASDGQVLRMGAVMFDLEELFLESVKPESGFVKIADREVPIIITTYYASNGIGYTDTSLYMLGMQIVLGEEEYARPEIDLNSLSFIMRFDDQESIPNGLLDDLLSGKKYINLPSGVL
ncbi:hypothetical protein ACWOGY_004296 [Vibrio vulnificus]|nr:hypothetical protein [Vibrio vulnificus]